MKKQIYIAFFTVFCVACTPRIQLETPSEGITINMNVVVDHKIEVQLDEKAREILDVPTQK